MDSTIYSEFYRYTTDVIVTLSWDAASQTHIPFRASLRHKHSTWARTNHSLPELYLTPHSIEEIRLIVELARRCGKKIVVVGSGHSPSNLTCTTSWMVNLDGFNAVVSEDTETLRIHVQAGIRLYELIAELDRRGWAMPNLGSIMEQSIAGAIATGTHGSSLRHGYLSDSIVSLKILLSDGRLVECSHERNPDLFQAALVSLGGLGIVTHVSYQAIPAYRVKWEQEAVKLPNFLESWSHVWEKSEYVRCWWFPYSERTIVWHGQKTEDQLKEPPKSWYGAAVGRYTYELLLYVATWFPKLMPRVERFVFNMQYGMDEGIKGSATQKSYQALTMDCLFSQFVNEVCVHAESLRPSYIPVGFVLICNL
jgi:D-arabinono-1,4-lactone oxidase